MKTALANRLRYIYTVILLPAWQWVTLGALAILGTTDTIRSDIYSALPVIPHLPALLWVMLFLVSMIFCVLESSYRLLQTERSRSQVSASVSAPIYAEGGTGGELSVRGPFTGRGNVSGGGGGQLDGLYRGGAGGSGEVISNPEGSGLISFQLQGGTGGGVGDGTGRGGRGARSGFEEMGAPTETWAYGRGGDSANHPEFTRRMALIETFIEDYFQAFPDRAHFIRAGIDLMPENWVNKRLEEVGEPWRVIQREGRFILPQMK